MYGSILRSDVVLIHIFEVDTQKFPMGVNVFVSVC